VSAMFSVVSIPLDDRLVCGCEWYGKPPERAEWQAHLRNCGWVGEMPTSPWMEYVVPAETPSAQWERRKCQHDPLLTMPKLGR